MKEAVLAIGSLFISISAPIGGHSMRPILQFLLMVLVRNVFIVKWQGTNLQLNSICQMLPSFGIKTMLN